MLTWENQEDTGKSRFDLAAIEQDDKGAWIREVLTAKEDDELIIC
ncbi:hypothetical protein [uncultured Thiocystis sp.]|jgi:hypothetical protein|nr:hypothetical protein [uncultured Thiocystis sp.]